MSRVWWSKNKYARRSESIKIPALTPIILTVPRYEEARTVCARNHGTAKACGARIPIVRQARGAQFCSDRCRQLDKASRYYVRTESKSHTPPTMVKYAGGKAWLVPQLRKIYRFHRSRRLVDMFAGGGSVTLGLRPKRALVNDVNTTAIAFYRAVAGGLVIPDHVDLTNDGPTFEANRARFNALRAAGVNDVETAALWYYLVKTGFNGLWRENRAGAYNNAWGKGKVNPDRDLTRYSRDLRSWEFSSVDFGDVALEPTDFVYADPPYHDNFTKYSAGGFRWNDQVRLAELLAAHPGPVVASNSATPEILDLYGGLGFSIIRRRAPRRISSDGDRTGAMEMIATRNTATAVHAPATPIRKTLAARSGEDAENEEVA